jgi:hypothetical protein
MMQTITGLFDTRREAEMAVERLVQEHGLDRNCIRAHAAGEGNTSGTVPSGANATAAAEGDSPKGVRRGRIAVTAEVGEGEHDRLAEAFRTCGAAEIGGQGRGPGA